MKYICIILVLLLISCSIPIQGDLLEEHSGAISGQRENIDD